MNRKVLLRSSLISLLLAALAPLLIALFISFVGGPLSRQLMATLQLGGVTGVYLASALAVFLLLLVANFAVSAAVSQSGSPHTSQRLAREEGEEEDDREIGEVKWFNVNKGYGFITRHNGDDVFVHFRAIRGKGHRTLAEGQKVRYHIIENERGLQADDVTIIT
ncbi:MULTISPECIES: cold-shock protein [unclassified Halomonas]|uniref:cold-shock protein n=1 Tax=Halomonadaceae TaxID=28256 RepID=UPI0015994E10|nr:MULTISPECIES: cold-shock protein [Halomonas]QJQ95019.1 cold-shock protein [Halomonas sp. PA5]